MMFGSRWGFRVGRSNGATFDFQKFKMAADGHLGYTEMVIILQPVCRSMWFLVLGWGFQMSLDFFSARLSCIYTPKRTLSDHMENVFQYNDPTMFM